MTIGLWNVNGWSANSVSENHEFRQTCLNTLNLDIICIAETHLLPGQSIDLINCFFVGHNRTRLLLNARNGSGGVCHFVKNDLLTLFNVSVLDNSYEGIIWVSFKHKSSNEFFNICVCYLPPNGSSRYVNSHEFYDQLLTNIYEYQHLGQFIICGDFNSRIGDMADYIEGFDTLPSRNVLDFTKNPYGEYLCKFLIDSNCCILNGRQHINNDFTFVSTRGRSAVDYFIVPYENLEKCKNFQVFRPTDVFNPSNGIESRLIPDHSIIACEYTLQCLESQAQDNVDNSTLEKRFKKSDLSSIPLIFCDENETRQVLETFINHENENDDQSHINRIYDDFCSVVKKRNVVKTSQQKRCD